MCVDRGPGFLVDCWPEATYVWALEAGCAGQFRVLSLEPDGVGVEAARGA